MSKNYLTMADAWRAAGIPKETLGDRVRWLINQSHGGNVVAATTDIGVRRRALHYVMSGQTRSPHHATLCCITDYYGVTLDWLIAGRGPIPNVAPRIALQHLTRDIARALPHIPTSLADELRSIVARWKP